MTSKSGESAMSGSSNLSKVSRRFKLKNKTVGKMTKIKTIKNISEKKMVPTSKNSSILMPVIIESDYSNSNSNESEYVEGKLKIKNKVVKIEILPEYTSKRKKLKRGDSMKSVLSVRSNKSNISVKSSIKKKTLPKMR